MGKLSNKGGGGRERHSQHPFGNKYALNTAYIQIWFQLYYTKLKCFQLIIITIIHLFLNLEIDYWILKQRLFCSSVVFFTYCITDYIFFSYFLVSVISLGLDLDNHASILNHLHILKKISKYDIRMEIHHLLI